MIPLIDLKMQYSLIKNEIDKSVLDVMESSQYIMGKKVLELEQKIAEYIGVKYAISCANGTDALVLSLKACGIGRDDEVITTPFTFFATAEAISRVGATPVFIDVNPETFNMDVNLIEKKITDKTKAIMPVHIFGQPVEMYEVNKIAKKYNLRVIEDACQAIGADYKGKRVGSLGDIGCFSFFPTKNLGCFGDGGIITTNDDNLAIILKALRVHGSGKAGQKAHEILYGDLEKEIIDDTGGSVAYDKSKYYNYIIGYNSRLDEMQAAILLVKLKYLDDWNNKRATIAQRYIKGLSGTALTSQKIIDDVKSVYHLYIIKSENRTSLTSFLNEKGISTGIYYPVPLHLQKAYKSLGYRYGDLPVAEYLSDRTFAIPAYPELTKEQVEYIIDSILSFKE
ncbi:MAG: DegT/DnrJ/EryC1/StrS family aminotransferase [Clostridia bacterium]|nr:DegT/DnrJ/EryC1/StrS family aminotransferase [Clostridia bacterium]